MSRAVRSLGGLLLAKLFQKVLEPVGNVLLKDLVIDFAQVLVCKGMKTRGVF